MEHAPPAAPAEPTTRTLHGETVIDAFTWMRDHEDPRLARYLAEERRYFDRYACGLAPLIAELCGEIGDREVSSSQEFTWRVGDHEYFVRAPAGSRHPRYLRRRVGTSAAEVVLDLGELGGDRPFTRIGVFEPSPDGRWLAYSVDHLGYESYELRFRDLRTGEDLPETRGRTYYTGAWSADSSTFLYTVHNDAMRPYQVHAHVLGRRRDRLIWTENDEHFNTTLRTTRNRAWIVISNNSRVTSEELLIPAHNVDAEPVAVEPRRHGRIYFTEHQLTASLDRFVLLVSEDGEERRLVSTPAESLAERDWRELVPADPALPWLRLDAFADGLMLSGHRAGTLVFQIFGVDGSIHEVVPENPAACLVFEGRRDATRVQMDHRTAYDSPVIALTEHSLVDPPAHLRVELRTGTVTRIGQDEVNGYDRGRYRTERLFARTPDGVEIPVTIAHRDDVVPDGTNPCFLTCYGAYERPWEPVFSPPVVSVLDRGFVYAIAHVRGGGELGRKGWVDGSMAATQNSFIDLVAARQRLVDLGWADPGGVVGHGSCAGGIVIGQAYTDHPDLWAGLLAETPAVDLLNALLDEKVPLTVNEWEEWGDPRDEATYRVMREYVAYERVHDRPRPPIMVTAFFHDPRVLVHRPARWVAALRSVDTRGNLILLRTELGEGGHHGPSTAEAVRLATAEQWAFVIDTGTGGRWR
ncbi:prolyl oligopeptidase family serine peptidase [Planosporangium sp. 12N6]|uniref:prolyl oligopeptidase family serine peptidase n=1 Tax=Planosporangium spinosum TaxID=3402278 RepID=UPI003CF8D7EE